MSYSIKLNLKENQYHEMINTAISKLGENIKLRRYSKIDKENYVFAYSHNNKIVSMVELNNSDDELAKDICMQIVASNPLSIDESSLDEAVLKAEKDIYKKELDKLDKKEDIKRNILEGKMKNSLVKIRFLISHLLKIHLLHCLK